MEQSKYQKQKNYRDRTIASTRVLNAAVPRIIAAYNALPDDLKRPEDMVLSSDKVVITTAALNAACSVLERLGKPSKNPLDGGWDIIDNRLPRI